MPRRLPSGIFLELWRSRATMNCLSLFSVPVGVGLESLLSEGTLLASEGFQRECSLMRRDIVSVLLILLCVSLSVLSFGQAVSNPANLPQRDGSHDFDFLIGNWRAHVRRLPDRLNNSNVWVEYEGISNHKKLLDSNANFEEFDVTSTDKKLHIKAQTLRLYNPTSHQWSIYLVDVDNGTLSLPPVTGGFTGNRGEFFDQEGFKGRAILVRYVWLNLSPQSARMEQSFSPDGGKTWEVNWICELSR
jgi:hypothetical protein